MDLVIGLGEIGKPILDIISIHILVCGRDIESGGINGNDINAMHVCYPYSDNFVAITQDYIKEYNPRLCIIHSTVVPGVTESIKADCHVAYSPVRGRHGQMHKDLKRYSKYVAGVSRDALAIAAGHLHRVGFNIVTASSCRALELAKLVETTYSGLLISWAQELERFCNQLGVDRQEVVSFTSEIDYLPDHAFYPGYIDGHCIIPNTHLLDEVRQSPLIAALRQSNEQRLTELNGKHEVRYVPERLR